MRNLNKKHSPEYDVYVHIIFQRSIHATGKFNSLMSSTKAGQLKTDTK